MADTQDSYRPRVHDGSTAWLGWPYDGELLRLAEGEFDLFITADQNILYQQTLAGRHIRILQLSTNNVRRIKAAAVLLQAAVVAIQPGDFRQIEIPRPGQSGGPVQSRICIPIFRRYSTKTLNPP